MRSAERIRLSCERGMTIVEVCMAMLVLVVGIIGSLGALDGLRTLGGVDEKKQQAARYATREIEHLRSLGWSSLQLSAAPPAMSDSRGTVSGATYTPPSGGTTGGLIIASSCATSTSCVDPGPTAWSAGNASGSVYRFVTSDHDTACGAPCAASIDRKRVTVAVTLNAPNNLKRAIAVSTLVIDPAARPSGTTAPTNPVTSTGGSSIGGATGTTYYLTDTRVGSTYAAPMSNHAVHDTVTATGVPDQARLATPAAPTDNQATARNYSTDVAPGSAEGLSVAGSATCGGITRQTAHEWVTPVISSSGAVTATGNAAITLPTSTQAAAASGGRVCVSVYNVALDASNHLATNTLLGASTYTLPVWPSTPDVIAFPFRYLPSGSTASLALGHRLGVRITVDGGFAPGLTFVYDHPNDLASVQLETQ